MFQVEQQDPQVNQAAPQVSVPALVSQVQECSVAHHKLPWANPPLPPPKTQHLRAK